MKMSSKTTALARRPPVVKNLIVVLERLRFPYLAGESRRSGHIYSFPSPGLEALFL